MAGAQERVAASREETKTSAKVRAKKPPLNGKSNFSALPNPIDAEFSVYDGRQKIGAMLELGNVWFAYASDDRPLGTFQSYEAARLAVCGAFGNGVGCQP